VKQQYRFRQNQYNRPSGLVPNQKALAEKTELKGRTVAHETRQQCKAPAARVAVKPARINME